VTPGSCGGSSATVGPCTANAVVEAASTTASRFNMTDIFVHYRRQVHNFCLNRQYFLSVRKKSDLGYVRRVTSPLDNPAWSALTGPQSFLAEQHGLAARFPADMSPFHAIGSPDGWADLAELTAPGSEFAMSGEFLDPPPGWEITMEWPAVQMVGTRMTGEPFAEAVELGAADVPEMLDLVERTKPGPFRKRTVELGRYLGVRRDGKLVAMAGERLRVPGYTEISAVCTDPEYRGQGLAAGLMRAVAEGILASGATPFLATLASNAPAIRVYERLGFSHRRDVLFTSYRSPL
jgi:ribosomal protein S18 acetylase RimI-like enzyme